MDLGIKGANDQIQTLTTAQRTALTPTVGQMAYDSTLNELFVYLNGAAGNAWFGLGNYIVCTSTTRPATPFNGQRIHETDTLKRYVYTGAAWIEMTSGIQVMTTAQRTALSSPTVGTLIYDSTLSELFVYTNATGGNAWQGIGNTLIGTFATRPSAPFVGQLFYQTDTDELVKYVTDVDGTNRWMVADHDFRRNLVINGAFDFWQRGTSFNPTSASTASGVNYGADRWQFCQATSSTAAFTRQAIGSTDPVGFNYYLRVQRASTLTHVTPYFIQTSFESQNIQAVRGKYVTLSFWARAGANYSAASSNLVASIVTGTGGPDGTVGAGTLTTYNTAANSVLTTSWKRFTLTTTAALGTTVTQLGIQIAFTPVGTAGAADYFDITGVMVEVSTAPSDFEFRDAGEELRRCQRYYYRIQATANSQVGIFGMGVCNTAGAANISTPFPTTMRAAPTALEQSGTSANYAAYVANATFVASSIAPAFSSASTVNAATVFTGSTLVAGQATLGSSGTASGASAYLGWSAEL
jgi:hypothetical protein